MKAFWACTITNKLKGLIRTIKALLFRLCPPFKAICCPTAAYFASTTPPPSFFIIIPTISGWCWRFSIMFQPPSLWKSRGRAEGKECYWLHLWGYWLQGGGGTSWKKPSRQPKWQQSKERTTKLRWCWLRRLKKNNNQLSHGAESRGGEWQEWVPLRGPETALIPSRLRLCSQP